MILWKFSKYLLFIALFLAYSNGAVGLCCALLRSGARIGTINKHGMSIFNAPVATKKLLFKLLGILFFFLPLFIYAFFWMP